MAAEIAHKAVDNVADSLGALASEAIPVPVLGSAVGWALAESIKWVAGEAIAVHGCSEAYRELTALLLKPRLLKYATALDEVTDIPAYKHYRPDYDELCALLQEVQFQLAAEAMLRQEQRQTEGEVEQSGTISVHEPCCSPFECSRRFKKLWRRVTKRRVPSDLIVELNAKMENAKINEYMQIYNELEDHKKLHVPEINQLLRFSPLQTKLGPQMAVDANRHFPELPEHIFQHEDTLLSETDELLNTVRNIGLLGMGGIGKSCIASAMCRKALKYERFHKLYWMPVGSGATNMMTLLMQAFDALFPGKQAEAENSDDALNELAWRVKDAGWNILLVLDDVWNQNHAIVASLNFATRASCRSEGSRLIVTTRDRSTLCLDPRQETIEPLSEMVVIQPGVLEQTYAEQLFCYTCFGNLSFPPDLQNLKDSNESLPAIEECCGHPLAIKALAGMLRGKDAQQCASKLKEVQDKSPEKAHVSVLQSAMKVCESSMTSLPPSLLLCAQDFTVHGREAEIPETELLHIFAMRAPLRTPQAVKATRLKLQALVTRGILTSTGVEPGSYHSRTPAYYMHGVFHDIAVQLAGAADTPRLDHWGPHPPAHENAPDPEQQPSPQLTTDTKYVTMRYEQPTKLCQLYTGNRELAVQSCILRKSLSPKSSQPCGPRALKMPRLQFLHLAEGDITDVNNMKIVTAEKPPLLNYIYISDCTGAADMLEAVLPAANVFELFAMKCTELTRLPDAIGASSQLTHLDFSMNGNVETLPEAIGQCSQLQRLNLSRNVSLQALPDRLCACTQLTWLDLSLCFSLQCLPDGLGACSQLVHLDLRECVSLPELPESNFKINVYREYRDPGRVDLGLHHPKSGPAHMGW